MGESDSERERVREEMEQGGKQGGNGGKNPATGKAPPGSGRDLVNLPPHRRNKIKIKAATGIVADAIRVISYAKGGN